MPTIEISRGTVITPEKKPGLIDIIKGEIGAISDAIRSKKYGDAALTVLERNQSELQKLLDKLFQKKGVITPDETDKVLDSVDASKRARLQKQAAGTMIFGIGAIIVIVAGFILFRKKKAA